MKIVYVTDSKVNPQAGGIARITYVMSEALRTLGYDVSVYYGQEDFVVYIQRIGKCIILVQSPCKFVQQVYASKDALPEVKLIHVFHGTPGFELIPLRWEITKYHLLHNIERTWTLKQLCLQIGMALLPKKCFSNLLRKKYAQPYGKADKIVVLSPGLIDQYQTIAPGCSDSFMAISNALSFEKVTLPKAKEKEVLVVARLEDWHKRISEILEIWEEVQQDKQYGDWILRIVGDGVDKSYYEAFVQRKHIPNICFEGQQNSQPYYQRAGLFLMTSACEGLPMTILEAQQCGCVPILYDSFASAKDIINSGKNGVLIANRDKAAYVAALKELMTNVELRTKMSEACVQSAERFSVEKVAAQWDALIQSLEQ